jgi:hypothetical protein
VPGSAPGDIVIRDTTDFLVSINGGISAALSVTPSADTIIAPLSILADNPTGPDLVFGAGSSVTNYASISGGRAMFGFDSAGPFNGAVAISGGASKGLEVYVSGTTGKFVTGTLAMSVSGTGTSPGLVSCYNGLSVTGTLSLSGTVPAPANPATVAWFMVKSGTSTFAIPAANWP